MAYEYQAHALEVIPFVSGLSVLLVSLPIQRRMAAEMSMAIYGQVAAELGDRRVTSNDLQAENLRRRFALELDRVQFLAIYAPAAPGLILIVRQHAVLTYIVSPLMVIASFGFAAIGVLMGVTERLINVGEGFAGALGERGVCLGELCSDGQQVSRSASGSSAWVW